MRKVTIEDISRDTGLSRGTVSRALNDRPDISTRTKQRVLETCRKLNYVPSFAARERDHHQEADLHRHRLQRNQLHPRTDSRC